MAMINFSPRFRGDPDRAGPQPARRMQLADALMQQGAANRPGAMYSNAEGALHVADRSLAGFLAGQTERDAMAAELADGELLANVFMPGGSAANPQAAAMGDILANGEKGSGPAEGGASRAASPVSGEFSEIGPRLMSDLMNDFELTPEQAAGVVGNLAHETGGFRHMQELQPMQWSNGQLVPSNTARGGFGFAQWTGPRRRQFESWAQEQGLDPNSYDANYGFLAHELRNTPEGRVLGDLRGAQDAASAARVFSDRFLRPGIPHMDSRLAMANQALGFAPSMADMPVPGASPASGQAPPDIAQALAQLHPENQPQAAYASMPGDVQDELGGMDMRRQPGAQPVQPLDAAARVGELEQLGLPADEVQRLGAMLLGPQATPQEAGIQPRVPGAGQDFQNVQATGDALQMGGVPGSFGIAGPGVQAGPMGVTPRTPFDAPSSAVEMGMQPPPQPEAMPQPTPPMPAPQNIPAAPPVASVADMPAQGGMPAQGQPQPAFMQAVNDPSIDPDAFGPGERMPRHIGNILAARSFIEQGREVPERLQGLIERDMQRGQRFSPQAIGSALTGGTSQPAMAAGMPQQAGGGMMAPQGGGMPMQGGMPAGGAPMPAQPGMGGGMGDGVTDDMLRQAIINPRTRGPAIQILQARQAEAQRAAQEQAERERELAAFEAAGIDPRFAGNSQIASAAASDRFRAPPTSVQEYEYGRENPEFFERQERQARAGANNITFDAAGNRHGNPPANWAWAYNPDGSVQLDERGAPIALPVGPALREIEQASLETEKGRQNFATAAGTLIQDAGRAIELMDTTNSWLPVAGAGSGVAAAVAPFWGNYDPNTMRGHIASVQSNIGIDRIVAMREAGGTLGAIPFQQQVRMEALLGSLNPDGDPAVLRQNLVRIHNLYWDMVDPENKLGNERFDLPFDESGFSRESGNPAEQGYPISGEIVDGYRFTGGDPGDPNNWERVQ